MNFGSTLRTYRILKGYSQKQLADQLNISVAALSKWENNHTYPDITMLKPLSSILGVTTDTLLGLQESIPKETADHLLCEINDRKKAGDVDGAVDIVRTTVRDYLNHDSFLSQVVILLYDSIKDQKLLQEWIDQVLSCDDSIIVRQLSSFLFHKAVNDQDLTKAQFYADYFDSDTYVRKSMDVELCQMKGDQQNAYRKTEELLFSCYEMVSQTLNRLRVLYMQDHNDSHVRMLCKKQKEAAKLFEMGRYHEISPELDALMSEEKTEEAVSVLNDLIDSIETIDAFRTSGLYAHMDFKPATKQYYAEITQMLQEQKNKIKQIEVR